MLAVARETAAFFACDENMLAEAKAIIAQAPETSVFEDPAPYFDFWIDKLSSPNIEVKAYAVRQIEVHQDRTRLMDALKQRPNAVEAIREACTYFWSSAFRGRDTQPVACGALPHVLASWGETFPNDPWADDRIQSVEFRRYKHESENSTDPDPTYKIGYDPPRITSNFKGTIEGEEEAAAPPAAAAPAADLS